MRRLAPLLLLLAVELAACTGDFSSCRQKLIDSAAIVNGTVHIALEKHRLVVSKTAPSDLQIVEHDPFLGLYLVKDETPFAHPYMLGRPQTGETALVDRHIVTQGRLRSTQVGLDHLGTFSEPAAAPALFSDACCTLLGVLTPRGVIERPYLEHFLRNGARYGDIGVRLDARNNLPVVTSVDPYFQGSPLKRGDRLISIDDVAFENAATAMRVILFLEPGSKAKIVFERAQTRHEALLEVGQRQGGGLISDTYLEHLGLTLDTGLRIVSAGDEAQKLGFRPGDRIVRVEKNTVETLEMLRDQIERHPFRTRIACERNGFQFFVHLP